MLYLDFAATSPLDEEAAETYIQIATKYYGNSSSLHDIGRTAERLLEACREKFSELTGFSKDGIYFTSGGSESNYLAVQALLSAAEKKGETRHHGMGGTFFREGGF